MTIARHGLLEQVKEALMKRARQSYPMEVCGFIMNSADPDTDQFVFDVPNVSKSPRDSWLMDPNYQTIAFSQEESIFGIWHTHPSGLLGPSETDMRYIIPNHRFFVVTRDGVVEYEMEQR
jgi:proteasome lid subunit RPN8/RPN11